MSKKQCELSCGYGGSVGALKAMGALEAGMQEDELKPLVDAWRSANPKIVEFWWDVDRAVMKTVRERVPTRVNAYFPVNLAIDTFLSEVYELSADGSRYRYKESSSQPGVEIKEGGKFVYSHHAKDPACLKLCSAFDIVRIHLFGDEDEKKSFRAMADFASKDEKVKMLILETRQREAETDFDVSDEDDSWKKKLEYEPRSTLLKNSLHNITLIMENDPNLKGIVFNQLADGMEIKGEVPWKHPARFWRDADDAQLISFVDSHYGSFSERNYRIAVTKVTDDRSYHPIREMFESLPPWDGVKRAETVLIDYLGAEDNRYVRAVTRKSLCAAYMPNEVHTT